MSENSILEKEREKAFSAFFKSNYTKLYYYAFSYIPDSEICKDILSDSFRHLWEQIENFNSTTALSYMFVHVHNLCIDYIRHTAMEHAHIESYLDVILSMNDRDWNETENRIEQIWEIIENMPSKTRFCMEQCYYKKKKYKDVALALGITESGVRKHIMKGLDAIRNKFFVKYKKGQ